MIQRIQTIYLTLSVVLLTLMFNFELATIEGSDGLYEFSILGLYNNSQDIELGNKIPLYPSVLTIIALLLFTISQYRNRKRQIRLSRIAFLLILMLIVGSYFLTDYFAKQIESTSEPLFSVGIYLAVACLPLIFLSIRGIKKDEALVKSLDRIR